MTDDERSWDEWRAEADEFLERLGCHYDMDGNPITLREWAESYEHPERRIVKQDHVGPYFVSTVLLGIDHGFDPIRPPVLFETMVFDKDGNDVFMDRYPNKVAALAGHDQAVERARRGDFEYSGDDDD